MKRGLFLAFIVLAAIVHLSAQETGIVYRVIAVEYDIDGKTKERPLSTKLDIDMEREFQDLASLESYVADRRQVLINQRVFANGDISYSLGEASGKVVPVTLKVYAKDTWNFIALPYPKYTTNDGFLFSLRARDYNFLGTMETLYLDLNYVCDENWLSSFGLGVEFTLPFELFKQYWSFNSDQGFSIATNGLITYTDVNTLNLIFYGKNLDWAVHFNQDFNWNASGGEDTDHNKLVLYSAVGVNSQIDLFNLGSLGMLTVTPDLTAGIYYRADGIDISEDRHGVRATASYVFAAGRADWISNFRRGTVLYFKNALTYNLQSQGWSMTALGKVSYYNTWSNRVGLNSRLVFYCEFNGDMDNDIGSYMRGVPDEYLDGDLAAFVNLDLPVRLFDFKPSLLIGKDWLDFEAHASPFVDAAIVRTYSDSEFHPYLTGGLELFGFLKRARSIYARLSVGVNALGYLETRSLSKNWELFFGLGHSY